MPACVNTPVEEIIPGIDLLYMYKYFPTHSTNNTQVNYYELVLSSSSVINL